MKNLLCLECKFKLNIMNKKFIAITLIAFTTAFTFTACEEKAKETESTKTEVSTVEANQVQSTNDTTKSTTPITQDVVDIAIGSKDHSTLVTAVTAAGLVETLKGAGPFTVFAPTNAAFEALPKGTVETLLKPESKADLASILTYHVVPGTAKAADLKDGQKLKTVNGKELTVSVKDGKVMIDGALVTTADLTGKNGVVHIINAVVLPKK